RYAVSIVVTDPAGGTSQATAAIYVYAPPQQKLAARRPVAEQCDSPTESFFNVTIDPPRARGTYRQESGHNMDLMFWSPVSFGAGSVINGQDGADGIDNATVGFGTPG